MKYYILIWIILFIFQIPTDFRRRSQIPGPSTFTAPRAVDVHSSPDRRRSQLPGPSTFTAPPAVAASTSWNWLGCNLNRRARPLRANVCDVHGRCVRPSPNVSGVRNQCVRPSERDCGVGSRCTSFPRKAKNSHLYT